MNRRTMLRQTAAAAASISLTAVASRDAAAAEASNIGRAKRGMVATVHPLATDAGVNALQRGGNAIDAAIAAAITLGVVDQHNSGLGGGCFVLLRTADGKQVAMDGRETAPAKAVRDMYVREGKPQPTLSQTGPLAVATPGALAGYDEALRGHGKLKLADLLLPAAEIAEAGFPLDRIYAGNIRSTGDSLARFEAGAKLLLADNGSPRPEGAVVKQPDLGQTLRAIARQGTSWFYQGEFAQAVGRWMQDNGGILSSSDFSGYRCRLRIPVSSSYRGHTLVGFPPPSSGGIHVAQILNILSHFDLAATYKRDRAEFIHIVAEAMKLAFADRAYWLGDPDFAKVPRGLTDEKYAAELAAKIDRDKATPVPRHNQPPDWGTNTFGKHTTHVAAADAEGNWVALTQTINTSFGSKVMVPGTGVFLNNEMDDFSIFPGQPNAFGLVGSEANAIAPGKRPLSSMSPTMVLNPSGQPLMTLGAAGGPTIISQVVLALARLLDLNLPLDDALALPRFHHQWSPDELRLEQGFDENVKQGLQQRGHKLKDVPRMGVTQLVRWEPLTKDFVGACDPRVPGKAAGP
ncbi:MAG TPA: gamma-glutamyltransferase [Pirellulaceae bacterium]|nr:gamma-glutamyltransferase [Pirellulaceae bacterium]